MNNMEKVIRDGKVAVLVSHGWGAGFYSWGAPLQAIFDPTLVDLIENNKIPDAIDYIEKTYPDAFSGGVGQLDIVWIPEGAKFIINEYDGSESLQFMDTEDWITA
jgi:hypothetical protein